MRRNFFIILFVVIVSVCVHVSFAQGKSLPLIVESQYFSVYGDEDIDIREMLQKLNFKYFLRADNLAAETIQDPEKILVRTIDALYLEASDILGIHIYSFHGKIKLYPGQEALNEAFRKYSSEDFAERSFYIHEENTIHISAPDLTSGMIGHEMAHAIQSHYFVVPPPAKVQEILSGYVEYSLRKSTGALP